MKSLIRSILEWPAVGRPVRKILWLFLKLTERQHQLIAKMQDMHPYIQKLNRLGGIDPLDKDGHLESATDAALFRYYRNLRDSLSRLEYAPQISLLLILRDQTNQDFLSECLTSIATQIYEKWELCVDISGSVDTKHNKIVQSFAAKYPEKVKIHHRIRLSHPDCCEVLALASGAYLTFIDPNDRLMPNTLGEVIRFINLYDLPDMLFTDESSIDEHGKTLLTYHKPGWSPLMLLSFNYIGALTVYKSDLMFEAGCHTQLADAWEYDLVLRFSERVRSPIVHIPINLYQRRSGEPPISSNYELKVVENACERRGTPAAASLDPVTHRHKVHFQLIGDKKPLVSIIIPSRDGYEFVKPCLESIFEKTSYNPFEVVLVDHETRDPRCLELFRALAMKYPQNFRWVPYEGLFNFAVMNNLGVREARGDYVVLLNNDTEVMSSDWIDELLAIAQLPQSGAVGPKLLYPNGKIQHAGIVGLGGAIAGHAGLMEKSDSPGYWGYHQTTHETLGITGACLMVSKRKYEDVGGLEIRYVANGFGDVDFCLRLQKKGYSNVYVPYAILLHKESVTRKVSFELFEHYFMLKNWSAELLFDPYGNVCLETNPHFRRERRFRFQSLSASRFREFLEEHSLK